MIGRYEVQKETGYAVVITAVLLLAGRGFSATAFCPRGDLDNNCEVGFSDVGVFASQWMDPPGNCSGAECADFDGINGVDATDFVLFAKDWREAGTGLVINEFMAANTITLEDPDDPCDFPDWVELYNSTDQTIDLGGMYLTDEFNDPNEYMIPEGIDIEPGEFLIFYADNNSVQGPMHTSFVLNADGEEIALVDIDGETFIDKFDFDNIRQVEDISYGRFPDGADTWQFMATPTPELPNQAVVIPPPESIIFNEILAHSDMNEPDWVELRNMTDETIDIRGWFLSDAKSNLKKFEIPDSTPIEPGGLVVFYQDQHFGDTNMPGCHSAFGLSENGETVYLYSGLGGEFTGYNEEQEFRASESNVAHGKYLKSTGTYNFVAMSENTPGAPNAYPKVGPIVINEIMYNPSSNDDAEYVELLNISDSNVVLYDAVTYEPWRFTDKPEDWTLDFFFPGYPAVDMASGEYLLLVKNLAAFNSIFAAPPGTRIFQWPSGGLGNSGEQPQLWMPGDVNSSGIRQYIRVDRVSYEDDPPWPTEPDGEGPALARKVPSDYGNDVINWKAATPSPGSANP